MATSPENLVNDTIKSFRDGRPLRPCRFWAEQAQTGPHNDQCSPHDTPRGFSFSGRLVAAVFANCRFSGKNVSNRRRPFATKQTSCWERATPVAHLSSPQHPMSATGVARSQRKVLAAEQRRCRLHFLPLDLLDDLGQLGVGWGGHADVVAAVGD